MSDIISSVFSLNPIVFLLILGIFCYKKIYKKEKIFQKKNIVFITIIPVWIVLLIILGSIQSKNFQKEAETQRIANKQKRIQLERIQERQKEIEYKKLIKINPVKVKSINLVCNNLSVLDLLKIVIKYNNDAGRFESMFIPLGLSFDINSELYKFRINLTEKTTDYLLEANILDVKPSEITVWVYETIWGYRETLQRVPNNERLCN
jgi:hypothetical protein